MGCRRLRLVGHSMPMDRIGVLLVSGVSYAFFVRMLWYGRLSFPQLVALADFSQVNPLRFCKRWLALECLLSSM